MKKFKFRLQKLLDIRVIQERNIQMELSVLMGRQNLELIKQQQLLEKINEQNRLVREKMTKGICTAADCIEHEFFVNSSRRAIESAEKRIQDMQPAIEEVRKRLTEATREKKVVEKLKERQKSHHDYENMRMENNEYDDINQNSFTRKRLMKGRI